METRNLIGGAWRNAASGKRMKVADPATDAPVAEVPECGAAETAEALDAAAAALPAWRSLTAQERAAPLRRMARLMLEETERLAALMTLEQGKPLAEARGEVAYAAGFLEWAAEEGRRVYGETIPAAVPGKRLLVLPRPVGVTMAVTPWNFPLAMITRKLGPALAAGCTQVVKPAEQTPLCAIAIAEISMRAELPPGVLNLVTGQPGPIVETAFRHPALRKVSFTGSTEVGKLLMRHAAERVVRLSLELGGHAPFLVFDDADLDQAVAGAVASKFRNTGQTCICANRILVQRGVHQRFLERFTAATRALVVGRGDQPGVQVGPLIDDAALLKVERHVEDARRRGARILCGGARAAVAGCADRFWQPTVIADATPEMECCREETFGPVAPVQVFDTEEEAIRRANDTPYGLAAYFYTRDASRLFRLMEALEYGVLGANDAIPAVPQAPFGGVKESGFGREGGRHGLQEYLTLHYVSVGIQPGP